MSRFATIVKWMAVEEWRLQTRLFGGLRFALFPLLLTGIVTVILWATQQGTGVFGVESIIFAVHLLALIFGLQTGAMGFIQRDALEHLLGEVTRLLYSGKVLPVSNRSLFSAFLLKDVGFYSLLFFAPLALAIAVVMDGGLVMGLELWITITLMFTVGLVAMLCAATSYESPRLPVRLLGISALAMFALISFDSGDIWSLTAYAYYTQESFSLVSVSLPIVIFAAIALYAFDPIEVPKKRVERESYDDYHQLFRLAGDSGMGRSAVAAKTFIDVKRSTGGFVTPIVSVVLLLLVGLFFIRLLDGVLLVETSGMWLVATTLSMVAFTLHSTLSRLDSPESYLVHPLSFEEVIGGKARVFAILAIPKTVAAYSIAGVLIRPSIGEFISGLVLLFLLLGYLYWVVIYLTGFEPDTHLFDVKRFAQFFIISSLAILPVAFVGVYLSYLPNEAVIGVLAYMGVLVWGASRLRAAAPAKWERILTK